MDINNFGPFHPDIWGTVSDWAMVTVTAITATYIYKTLKSQTEVQKIQQKVLKIESERYRLENKPVFHMEGETIKNTTLTTNQVQSIFRVNLKLSNNDSKNISLTYQQGISTISRFVAIKLHTPLSIPIEYFKKDDDIILHFEVLSIAQLFPHEGANLSFFIEYEDLMENKYRQNFFYVFQDSVIETHHKLPERIL